MIFFRKPVPTPHQVRSRLFGIMLYFGRRAARGISANAPMVAIMRQNSTIFSMPASAA
jgi:hypothetical protein